MPDYNKGTLMGMLTSNEWRSNTLAKTKKRVKEKYFEWLEGYLFLITGLCMVDSDEIIVTKFIYREIDQAKERRIRRISDGAKWR